MENQCLGLAEALEVEPVIKRIVPRFPWSRLPPQLWFRALSALGPEGDRLSPPWPDLLIASGRRAVAPAVAVRDASERRTFTVQIQNPSVDPRRFDLIATPRHDGLEGDNVVVTEGALHRVTEARLAAEAERFRPLLSGLPRPLVAVLVGGSNGQYRMTEGVTLRLVEGLAQLARETGAGLAVTASRRTGAGNEALLRAGLAELPAAMWDGIGDNPYFGYLGLADAIVVTGDSVCMVSEACATGKPVYVFDLDGGSKKFRRFHRNLRDRGITRPFDGELVDGKLGGWSYAALDDTERVAGEVRRRMGIRRRGN